MKAAVYGITILTALVFATTSVAYAQWETANILIDGWKACQKIEADEKSAGAPDYLRAGVYLGYIMGFLHGTGDNYKIPVGVTPKQLSA